VIIVIGIFISTIVYLTGDVISSRISNSQSYMIQDALDRIERDVKLSTQFLATNSITPIQSPQGYNDGGTAFDNVIGSTEQILILNMFGLSKPPSDESRNILYIPNAPNACNSGMVDQNTPLMFNIVYFVKNNSLIRRVVAPETYDDAGGNCDPSTQAKVTPWQLPSCTTGYTTPSFCKTNDEILVTGLIDPEGFVVKYFESGSIVEIANASNSGLADNVRQTALDTADMATITINTSITAAGRDVNDSGTIRATKYNSEE
jgi:hypothetical protein